MMTMISFSLGKRMIEMIHSYGNTSARQQNFLKFLLFLCHEQAQIEREFSINRDIVVFNSQTDSMITQKFVNKYMRKFTGQRLQPYEVPMAIKLWANGKNTWSRYFQVLDERRHTKERSEEAKKSAIAHADNDKINE